jgi:glycosyltransferase involved in cell wall biosynthesis
MSAGARRPSTESLPRPIIINGRFLMQRLSGVQRVATEMLRALDADPSLPAGWRLLVPRGTPVPALRRIEPWPAGPSALGGHAWEQSMLARLACGGACVLNLAGSGPWLGGRQVSCLHDAAVFDEPWAYRAAFVAWYRALFRRRARRGDLLVVPSAFAQERLALHLRVAPERLVVLGHGADHFDRVVPDPGLLQRHGLENGHFLLAVASANPTKNLPRLMQAHARLDPARRPRLVLVGDVHPRVFASTAIGPVGDGVLPLGRVDDTTLKALYARARALVMPSLVEGFGLPAVEAMREGCAVIAARAGALPEVCGDAALWVEPTDVDALAAAMQALDDTALRDELVRRGRARVAGQTWSAQAARLRGLLAVAGFAP